MNIDDVDNYNDISRNLRPSHGNSAPSRSITFDENMRTIENKSDDSKGSNKNKTKDVDSSPPSKPAPKNRDLIPEQSIAET